MITRQTLLERVKLLEQQREQLLANVNATAGAIEVLKQVLVEWDQQEGANEPV